VQLNGTARRDPETPVELQHDRISVEGNDIRARERVYLMMNKPRGLVTTAQDEKGRKTVYSLVDGDMSWVAPVGRLDKASEGLLLFTNDSEWGARIASPETHLEKTYHVQIGTVADEGLLTALTRGWRTEAGDFLRVQRVAVLRQGEKNCWLEIRLDEGKNRHIRRMLEALGIEVLRLMRVAIGGLQLGELPKGAHRSLTPQEKQGLDHAVRKSPTKRATKLHQGRSRFPQ
jgi:23S rRNA pseudouridine2605 synthase